MGLKCSLKVVWDKISYNGPKNIHAIPNNIHGDCTLLAHVNLMSLNIAKNEIIKKGVFLILIFIRRNNYRFCVDAVLPPDEVMAKYSKDLSHFHQKSWKMIKKEQYQQDGI